MEKYKNLPRGIVGLIKSKRLVNCRNSKVGMFACSRWLFWFICDILVLFALLAKSFSVIKSDDPNMQKVADFIYQRQANVCC